MVGMFNGLTELKARAELFSTLNGCFTTDLSAVSAANSHRAVLDGT